MRLLVTLQLLLMVKRKRIVLFLFIRLLLLLLLQMIVMQIVLRSRMVIIFIRPRMLLMVLLFKRMVMLMRQKMLFPIVNMHIWMIMSDGSDWTSVIVQLLLLVVSSVVFRPTTTLKKGPETCLELSLKFVRGSVRLFERRRTTFKVMIWFVVVVMVDFVWMVGFFFAVSKELMFHVVVLLRMSSVVFELLLLDLIELEVIVTKVPVRCCDRQKGRARDP